MHAVLPEDLRTKPMERVNVYAPLNSRNERGHAVRHFRRRLGGERQCKNAKTLVTRRVQ